MKTKLIFLILLSTILFACDSSKKPKILIAYYSLSGNTKAVAEQIHAKFGGDLFEIKTLTPYPGNEQEAIEIIQGQRAANIKPELSGKVANINEYDIIFIGTPIWFGTASLPVFSFVESHDFAGKTIIPFYTCGRGDQGTYVRDIQAICEGATFLESFGNTRPEREAGTHTAKIEQYLEQLVFEKK